MAGASPLKTPSGLLARKMKARARQKPAPRLARTWARTSSKAPKVQWMVPMEASATTLPHTIRARGTHPVLKIPHQVELPEALEKNQERAAALVPLDVGNGEWSKQVALRHKCKRTSNQEAMPIQSFTLLVRLLQEGPRHLGGRHTLDTHQVGVCQKPKSQNQNP